ncbi:MAG: GxxExxY protein [Saprospiraceae bacterium]
MGLLYEELSYILRGYIYDVHNEVGVGFDEEIYQLALEQKLRENNISFRSQEIRYVEHKGKRVHKFVLDLIIEDKIILELKCIETNFHPEHVIQLLSYLKCWKKRVGFLVNFGLPKAEIKRYAFTEKEKKIVENYDYIRDLITPNIRPPLMKLRDILLTIFEIHGVGYRALVYEKILLEELSIRQMKFTAKPIIPVKNGTQLLKEYEIKWPLINNQFICGVTAFRESTSLDIIKVKTYLKSLNLPLGLMVHFGKKQLEIYGVSP